MLYAPAFHASLRRAAGLPAERVRPRTVALAVLGVMSVVGFFAVTLYARAKGIAFYKPMDLPLICMGLTAIGAVWVAVRFSATNSSQPQALGDLPVTPGQIFDHRMTSFRRTLNVITVGFTLFFGWLGTITTFDAGAPALGALLGACQAAVAIALGLLIRLALGCAPVVHVGLYLVVVGGVLFAAHAPDIQEWRHSYAASVLRIENPLAWAATGLQHLDLRYLFGGAAAALAIRPLLSALRRRFKIEEPSPDEIDFGDEDDEAPSESRVDDRDKAWLDHTAGMIERRLREQPAAPRPLHALDGIVDSLLTSRERLVRDASGLSERFHGGAIGCGFLLLVALFLASRSDAFAFAFGALLTIAVFLAGSSLSLGRLSKGAGVSVLSLMPVGLSEIRSVWLKLSVPRGAFTIAHVMLLAYAGACVAGKNSTGLWAFAGGLAASAIVAGAATLPLLNFGGPRTWPFAAGLALNALMLSAAAPAVMSILGVIVPPWTYAAAVALQLACVLALDALAWRIHLPTCDWTTRAAPAEQRFSV